MMWKKVRIEDVCDILDAHRIPITAKDREKGIYPYYGANGIQDYVKNYIFDGDYVLIAEDGGHFGSKTNPISFRVSGKFWVNNHAHILKAREKIHTDFLYYSTMFYDVSSIINGATRQKLTQSALRKMEIPLPAMEAQKKIAARLDAVSDLLAKQKQLLAEQDTLIQSLFYDMFGDPIKNNKGWKIEKFKKLGTLERGKSQHRPRNAPELLGGPYPLIQTGDIAQAGLYLDSFSQTYSELGLKQSRLWKKGTLCITIAANIAKTSILNFDACFPDSVVGFVNNTSCNIMFIQIWMSFLQKILENNAPQAAQKNINLEILGNLDVILPPLELQEKFAAIVEQIESEKSKIKSAITETQTLFNALMAEYFEE